MGLSLNSDKYSPEYKEERLPFELGHLQDHCLVISNYQTGK